MAKTVCRERGFTLTELLIVVVIIGILTAITYPAYRGFVLQSNRSDAHISLLEASQQLERWFTENNTYAGYTYNGTDITTSGSAAASRQGHYALQFTADPGASGYTLGATASGDQASDSECITLTIDQTGLRTPAGCWD